MQTHGGFSYAKEYDIERKWREVRLHQMAPISTNLVLACHQARVAGSHPSRSLVPRLREQANRSDSGSRRDTPIPAPA